MIWMIVANAQLGIRGQQFSIFVAGNVERLARWNSGRQFGKKQRATGELPVPASIPRGLGPRVQRDGE